MAEKKPEAVPKRKEMKNENIKNRKFKNGRVVSDSMDKTIVVASDMLFKHPIYKKTIKRTVKYKAHDEKNEAKVGDSVEITETRPISRDKRWRLSKITERAK